jgi:hypothetical protein
MMRYKQVLDNQMDQRRSMALYGNMTEAEKKFNKNDLISYKNNEHVSYGMIPGIQTKHNNLTNLVQAKRDK